MVVTKRSECRNGIVQLYLLLLAASFPGFCKQHNLVVAIAKYNHIDRLFAQLPVGRGGLETWL